MTANRTPQSILSEILTRAHSHNDYAQNHPLYDAIDNNIYSVEADIWLSAGRPMVSHWGWFYKGSLEDLYLTPLQKIVDQRGSVYGDGRPFYLWVDLKEKSPYLRRELNELLNRFPMLTVFSEQGTKPGPVTVILTGDSESKRKFVEEYPERRACRDADGYDDNDPPADHKWSWYAMPWDSWMENEPALRKFVDKIHSKGRRVRLYAVPQLQDIWRGAVKAQVDQLSADDLPWAVKLLKKMF